MLLFSKLWYNVLMNRKVSKIDYKILVRYILILGIAVGGLLTTNGILQIKTYKDKVGDRPLEEITEEYNPLTLELGQVKREKFLEYEKNGESEKYIELSKKQAELEEKIKPLSESKFMKETGYHNPKSLAEVFEDAPTLGVGLFFIVGTIVVTYVLVKLDREKAKAERAANKTEKKEAK